MTVRHLENSVTYIKIHLLTLTYIYMNPYLGFIKEVNFKSTFFSIIYRQYKESM